MCVCVCVCTCVCVHCVCMCVCVYVCVYMYVRIHDALREHILTLRFVSSEPAGTKQVSPVSPTRPPLHTTTLSSGESGSVEPVALNLPTVRVRRNSDNNKPSPKYVAGSSGHIMMRWCDARLPAGSCIASSPLPVATVALTCFLFSMWQDGVESDPGSCHHYHPPSVQGEWHRGGGRGMGGWSSVGGLIKCGSMEC